MRRWRLSPDDRSPLPQAFRSLSFWERFGCRPCCFDETPDNRLPLSESWPASVSSSAYVTEETDRDCTSDTPRAGQIPHDISNDKEYVVREGVKYRGQWNGEHFHGHGLLIRDDGSCYEGEFVWGEAQGRGRYVHLNGSTYEGEWWKDDKSGSGVEIYADGSTYKGQFLLGVKQGMGTYTSSSGLVLYEGLMHGDRMHGEGAYNFLDGRTYMGEWRSGHMDGEGVMDFADGSQYRGSMKDDARVGEGTFYLPNGQILKGQWSNGKPDGDCMVATADGKYITGKWKNGKCISESSTILSEDTKRLVEAQIGPLKTALLADGKTAAKLSGAGESPAAAADPTQCAQSQRLASSPPPPVSEPILPSVGPEVVAGGPTQLA